MTQKQNYLYWREWAAVRRADPEADRHALHAVALGADKSHLKFSNTEFDKVLAEFRAISQPANVGAQLRQINQPRTRLVFAIRKLADDPYIAGLLKSARFKSATLDDLSLEELENFRNTCAARMSAHKGLARGHRADAPQEIPVINGVMVPF